MAKQQSTQELVNELEEAVKTSKALLKQFNSMSKVISETAQDLKDGFGAINKGTTKGLADFNKLIAQTNKLLVEEEKNNQEKEKTERELIKNQQELSKLKKIQIQEQQAELRLKSQIQKEQEKIAKAQEKQAKLDAQENSAYAKKSKNLNELRKQYKDLAAAEKENTKEAKKLLKQITSLDKELKKIDETVGQNQRSVGDYGKAMEKLNGTIGKLGITAVLVKGVELLTSAFGDSRNGALAMEKMMVRVNATLQVLGQRLGTVANDLVTIFKRDGGTFQFFDNLNDGLKTLLNGFDGVGSQIDETIKRMDKLTGINDAYKIKVQELERTISRLSGVYKVYLQIAENDTLSFERREAASKQAEQTLLRLNKVEEERVEKLLELATEEIAIKIGVEREKKQSTEDYAKAVMKALEDPKKAMEISQADDEAFTNAVVENNTVKAESQEAYGDFLEKQAKLYSDWAEVNLTIDTDLYEAQKELNVKRVEDEREAIDERNRILESERNIQEKFLKRRLQIIIDQRKRTLENEKKLGEISKEQYELDLKKLNLQTLLNIVNEENLSNQTEMIKNLKLGEKFTELFVVEIKENTAALIELDEAQKSVNDSSKEYNQLVKDNELITKKYADANFDLEKARREERKKQIREEMEDLSADSVEFVRLENELYQILLEEQTDALSKNVAKRKELIEESIAVIEQVFDKANEKRTKQIEDELSATEKRINDIQRSAELGNEAAQQSLAAEERKQAELERKKEQQRRREQRQEMLIAGLNLLSENADNPNALGKSISDVAALVSIVSSLPTYLKGTEDTGNGGNLDAKGGFLSVLHPNERVLTKEQNKALGGLTNEEVAELGRLHNMGAVEYSPVVAQSNKVLEDEVKGMRKAIESLHERIPIQKVDYNAKAKEYEHRIESNNKTEILRRKARGLWR